MITSLGAYLSRRIDVVSNPNSADISVNHHQMWQDLIAMFTLIGSISNWLVNASRNARKYCDLALLPWLSKYGVQLSIPTIDLPRMPASSTSNSLNELVKQDI
ncbi:hypothetical protein [Leptolyngbya sp. AN03gr2]